MNSIKKTLEKPRNTDINLFLVGTGLIGSTLLKHIAESAAPIHIAGLANSRTMLINSHHIPIKNWKKKLSSMKKKRLGILGGISYESTTKYYELFHQKYFQKFGNYYFPEVVVMSLDFQKFTDYENNNDMEGYIRYIKSGMKVLENARTDVILMAANSPHSVFNEIQKRTRVPMISIVEVTAEQAHKKGYKKLLLFGIRYTMQKNFYAPICAKYGIGVIVPNDREQNEINNIIFQELCIGKTNDASRKKLVEIIDRYNPDATILGCTELPLLLDEKNTEKKLLNPMDIHLNAALDCLC